MVEIYRRSITEEDMTTGSIKDSYEKKFLEIGFNKLYLQISTYTTDDYSFLVKHGGCDVIALEQSIEFLELYRETNNKNHLEISKLLRKAGHNLYRKHRKIHKGYFNNRFLNLV